MSMATTTVEKAIGAEVKTRRPLLKSGGTIDDPSQRGAGGNSGPLLKSSGTSDQAPAAQAGAGGNGNGRPPAALTLRLAGESDLVPLGFFFDTLLRKDYFLRRGQLADMLRSPYHRVYVAEIETILVGAAITTRGTRLVNVLVHPAYRGLGIGKALVGFSDVTEVRAKLDMSSGDPRGFYAALGFERAADVDPKDNIEIMRLPQKRVSRERRPRVARAG